MTSMMEVGNGEEEDLSDVVHDVSRPLDEWPPPPALDASQKNNLNQSASRLLFLADTHFFNSGTCFGCLTYTHLQPCWCCLNTTPTWLKMGVRQTPETCSRIKKVEYVEEPGVSNNTAFNTSFEGEPFPQLSELEQRVVSPLDPNMSCTACYSPVQYISRPSSPFQSTHTIIVDPPSNQQVSPSHGYLSSTQATSLSSPSHTTASLAHSPLPQPDPGLIVMGNQFSHSGADSYVVTSAGRIIANFHADDHDTMSQAAHEVLNDPGVLDSDKLLLHTSGLHHPSEQLVVSGGDEGAGLEGLKETEGNGRVELLLSNGSIAYGIVGTESTLVGGTHRIIHIPREYLLAAARGQMSELNGEEEENHLRAIYNTLKTQGLIVEASDGGELRLVSDLEQNEHMLDPGLLDQSVLLNEEVDNMPETMATDAEQSYQISDSSAIRSTSAEEPDEPSEPTDINKTYSEQIWMQDYNKRCEDCNASLDHECAEHRVNSIISDKPIPSRARATLPASYLVISKLNNTLDSEIDMAPRSRTMQWSLLLDASGQLDPVWYHDMCFHGDMVLGVLVGQSSSTMEIHHLCHRIKVFGVFARKVIPKRTQFGPIEGVIHYREDLTDDIVPNCGAALLELSIETESGEVRKLDISDEYASNWMRFVRPATCVKEQNLILSQQGLSLYFTTTRTIHPRQELKVWYNTLYASKRKLPMLEQEKDEQWPCFECDQKFKSSEELQKHLNVHEIARDEHDEITKTKKTNHYMLRRKVQSYFPPIKKYKLGEKKIKFSVNSKNPYECIICKRAFQRSYSLKRHILQHTGDKKYSCTVCQLSFTHLYNRDRHMKRCHQKKSGSELQENRNKPKVKGWQCGHCNLTFTSASVLNLHTLTHAADNLEGSEGLAGIPNDLVDTCFKKQNGKIGCPQCTEEFSNRKELIQHVSTHGKRHQVKDKQFRCESCSKVLASSEGLQKHSLVHEGDENKPYQCDVCKKRFTHNYGLTCHMKTHETGKVFECPICKEQFDVVLSLKNHIHTHSENGVYKCPHCSKDFEVYSMIRKHILTVHTRKHTCHYCGKNYPSLEKHMLMHSDHREFLCANCGKQFKRKDKLVEHMRRMHTEEREQQIADKAKQGPANKKTSKLMANTNDYERFIYKCHACMLGFKRRGMLVNHLANRHPEITPDSVPELNLPILKTTRDYYCQYCEKIYKSSSKRKAHILKNHPGLDLPMSNRQKGGIPEIPGMPNPTYSQPVGSITTDPQGCQWCHKQYASKAKLLQHQRKKHLNLLPRSQQVPRPTTKSQEDNNNGNEKTQDVSSKNAQPATEKNGRTPVPVALSTIHSINLLQGDYEIVTADAAAVEYSDNGIVIDAADLKNAAKAASQSAENPVPNEDTEDNEHDETSDNVEQSVQPVPIALSTVHSVNLLSGVPGDYEIVTADGEFAENGMIIDAATFKRAVKAEVLSADLLSQTVAELGISLPDLQALSSDQYVKIIQTPNGVVAQAVGLSDSIGIHDPFFTPYTAR